MDINKHYAPQQVESKWYDYWEQQGFFQGKPDRKAPRFSVVMPPPNVTGMLHLGHMLNHTIQDVLARHARMQGKDVCWVPGTDHASIATETKVVQMLREKGIDKRKIGRDEFLRHAWAWKEKYGGVILKQLRRIGVSCDWSRTRFTMEDALYKAVINVFVILYEKGYIYRGARMINWDPAAKTALSDEEVNHKEVQGKLYHVRYKVEQEADEWVTIATTRPETILGDTAVCVNPNDKRYQHLRGKRIYVPLIKRVVPVIQDDYVDIEFGTGCLKVTPAHDENDYAIGQRHKLKTINIFHADGTLNEDARRYVGKDRFEARKMIVKDLEEAGHLVKVEAYTHKVGFSERTDVVIEPRQSMQWFCRMDKMAEPALKAVMADDIRFFPKKFKNTYRHWMENIKDWCISRQLWWGQRIPAYYLPDGSYVVAKTPEQAFEKARAQSGNHKLQAADLKQDEDVLDTWFSSWLWPIAVFDGFKDPDNLSIKQYYPTDVLVTGPDIIFFWVARMIMAGYEFRGEKPFHNVYFTGMVRDKKGRKMSKSLGNSPDLLTLLDKYGADGVRTGVLFSAPAGNDLLFDEKQCEQGRNFANKIWNAFRLVRSWETDKSTKPGEVQQLAVKWFHARFREAVHEVDDHFSKYRISDALMTIYKLIWDDFCSWYLEMMKPADGRKMHPDMHARTIEFFEQLMALLHPLMPFLTEEVWQHLRKRKKGESLMISPWPEGGGKDARLLEDVQHARKIVAQVRDIRKTSGISPKQELELVVQTNDGARYHMIEPLLCKLANLFDIKYEKEEVAQAKRFILDNDTFFVPLEINEAAERQKLEEDLQYTKGFLQKVSKKLENEKFVKNAPERVVEKERKKQAEAQQKVKLLEESLSRMNGR